jgi:DNA repair ATPase RecN
MNNIKTVEVLDPIYGLTIGDVLTRENDLDNFSFSTEHIGEDYNLSRSVSLSPNLITKENFTATEWFEEKKAVSKKAKVEELEDKLESAYMNYEELLQSNQETAKRLEECERALESEERYCATLEEYVSKIDRRIGEKIDEYETKLSDLKEKVLDDEFYSGEVIEWADEAMTVYYNLIDLLKKLRNE